MKIVYIEREKEKKQYVPLFPKTKKVENPPISPLRYVVVSSVLAVAVLVVIVYHFLCLRKKELHFISPHIHDPISIPSRHVELVSRHQIKRSIMHRCPDF